MKGKQEKIDMYAVKNLDFSDKKMIKRLKKRKERKDSDSK